LGANEEEALNFLKAIDSDFQVKPVDSFEENVVSFKIQTPKSEDIRELLYLSIKKTDWIIYELTKESQALESIFRKLTKEAA
jgi:ABC-2 type transport system ATP-binding protein